MRSSVRRLVLAAAPLAACGVLLATAGPSAGAATGPSAVAATGPDAAPSARVLAADPAAAPITDPAPAPTPAGDSSDGFSWG
ncbi:hypothetical protein OG361_26625 [Streptomyces sp. NBC_00090]|uniref:hypothetical protein n=1 Tax=Streptomyces sp. NBC_00090 TaxID=2903619 RepID=UPI00324C784B